MSKDRRNYTNSLQMFSFSQAAWGIRKSKFDFLTDSSPVDFLRFETTKFLSLIMPRRPSIRAARRCLSERVMSRYVTEKNGVRAERTLDERFFEHHRA
jgi:hypothetical protein